MNFQMNKIWINYQIKNLKLILIFKGNQKILKIIVKVLLKMKLIILNFFNI